jgi:hypothetical protein
MPEAKVTVAKSLPVGNYVSGFESNAVMHIFSIEQVIPVNMTPSGMQLIPSFTKVVTGSSSRSVISVVKSIAIVC